MPVALGQNGGDNYANTGKGYVLAMGSDGRWGGVCHHDFDINDAHVICRMLGYSSARTVIDTNTYGTYRYGNRFVLDNLECDGSESSVFDCPHRREIEDCISTDIAAVQCESKSFLYNPLPSSIKES